MPTIMTAVSMPAITIAAIYPSTRACPSCRDKCTRRGALQYWCAKGQRDPIRNRAENRQLSGDGSRPGTEIARAKTILGNANPTRVDLHTAANTAEPAVAA